MSQSGTRALTPHSGSRQFATRLRAEPAAPWPKGSEWTRADDLRVVILLACETT